MWRGAVGENELDVRHELADGLVKPKLELLCDDAQHHPLLREDGGLVWLWARKARKYSNGPEGGANAPMDTTKDTHGGAGAGSLREFFGSAQTQEEILTFLWRTEETVRPQLDCDKSERGGGLTSWC